MTENNEPENASENEPIVNLTEYFGKETEDKPEPEEEFKQLEDKAAEIAAEEAKQQKDETEKKEGFYNFGDSAETVIDIIDQLQTIALPFVHQLALLNSDDRKALKHLSRRYREYMNETTDKRDKKGFTLSTRDQELLDIKEELEDYEKDLPFTDKEREQLKKPLKDLLAKSDFKMSPGSALTWSAVIVMAPRIIPIVAGMVQRFMGKK
jgi:hypothetical protein